MSEYAKIKVEKKTFLLTATELQAVQSIIDTQPVDYVIHYLTTHVNGVESRRG